MKYLLIFALVGLTLYFVAGCATANKPLPTVSKVDLDRFMGPWFVIGYTPLGVDGDAHNAVEHYHLDDSGKIKTTYQFRRGGFDGELKTMTPVGRVYDGETNAEWRMQFFWPFEAEYLVFDLSPDYQRTIIAHPNRKYAWIMARSPEMTDSHYQAAVAKLKAEGFDPEVIQRLPHDWSSDQERLKRIREAGTGKFPMEE